MEVENNIPISNPLFIGISFNTFISLSLSMYVCLYVCMSVRVRVRVYVCACVRACVLAMYNKAQAQII